MAGPLRFRHAPDGWHEQRVRDALQRPLDDKFGAELADPWFAPPGEYEAGRLEMDNGDLALVCWDDELYWLGNTETPQSLWQTEKYTFDETPYPVARWAQRELLATLEVEDPWLAAYDHLAWFFLPVFFSKDGRESTRSFFRDHAAGFPDADRDEALAFFDDVLSTGVLDDHRYTMASKLGTSDGVDLTRMQATMGEFTVAWLLERAGNDVEPEVELSSGHALDFQVEDVLVEVTRPLPPNRRKVDSPLAAVKETGRAKRDDQIAIHGNAVLVVDCSSFRDDEWARIRGERPDVGHEPAIVFRARPDGSVEGYATGNHRLGVERLFEQPA